MKGEKREEGRKDVKEGCVTLRKLCRLYSTISGSGMGIYEACVMAGYFVYATERVSHNKGNSVYTNSDVSVLVNTNGPL